MRKFQSLLLYAAVAFVAVSCSSVRSTSDASSSNGRKPRLADRVEHERMDLDRAMHSIVPEAQPMARQVATPPTAALVSARLIDQAPPAPAAATNEVASVTAIEVQRVPGRSAGVGAVSLLRDVLKAAPLTPAAEGGGGTNVWAIVGFVCAFFIPLLGIIFSLIALSQIKRTGEKGHGLALAGLIISIVTMLIAISLLA